MKATGTLRKLTIIFYKVDTKAKLLRISERITFIYKYKFNKRRHHVTCVKKGEK